MERLSSRKLAAVIAAILGISGILLGLAVIDPTLLKDVTSVGLVGGAVAAISGLCAFTVHKQAGIDEVSQTVVNYLPGDAQARGRQV